MKKYITPVRIGLAGLLFATGSYAQDQNQEDQVYDLSPFEVDASQDSGYMATNTLAGTRLNTSLRDLASSVSVYTEAFVEDLGATSIEDLADYTTNMILYDGEDDLPGVLSDRDGTTAQNTVQNIRIRGIEATQGVDYFRSITPNDSYRSGRYDEARGPNSILFGLSGAGGIVNSTSLSATTSRDSGRVRFTTEDTGGLRGEFRYNKVLLDGKLAVAVAGVDQQYEEWQVNTYDDTRRLFATITYRITDDVTLRANYENGTANFSNQTRAPALDFGGVAYYDWYNYLSTNGDVNDLLLTPRNNNNPYADEAAYWNPLGTVVQNVSNATAGNNSGNRRYAFITNNDTLFDSAGTFFFRGYGDQRVDAPPDANWVNGASGNGNRPRVHPGFLPPELNTDGPGAFKDYDFENYSLFLDWHVWENLYINLSHNHQEVDINAYNIGGFAFQLNADNNKTLGLGENFFGAGQIRNPGYGPNPYAGMWYLESNWRNDTRRVDIDSTRLAASYQFELGSWSHHQVAAVLETSEEFSYRQNRQLGLTGRPYSDHWNNPANRIEVRTYYDFDAPFTNPESFHIGHWNTLLGKTFTLDDRDTGEPMDVEIGWTNRIPGNENRAGTQTVNTYQVAMQNFWFNDRLVTTFGYRNDESDLRQYYNPWADYDNVNVDPDDPIQTNVNTPEELKYGVEPDYDKPEYDDQFVFSSETVVAGAVFHLTDNLSLVANYSDNIGFPDFNRTLYPTGVPTPPPEGEGYDVGINFSMLDNRVSGRLVYYETDQTGVTTGLANGGQYDRLVDTAHLVVDAGIMTEQEWNAIDAERLIDRRGINGDTYDKTSNGIEFQLVANITRNWRLRFNASKTDRITTNFRNNMQQHMGMLPDPDSDWNGVIDPFDSETGTIDPDGFDPDGTFAFIYDSIASLIGTPQAGGATKVGDITSVGNNATVFQDWSQIVSNFNDQRIAFHKRWGLRPYRANVFTTYDFTDGMLDGFSIGGGISWQDKMIVGEDEATGEEWTSRDLWNTDLMLRYRWDNGIGPLRNPITLQLNVSNVFDDQDIIVVAYNPPRGPRWELPYDRGYAMDRYDIPNPRSWRLTLTYEF